MSFVERRLHQPVTKDITASGTANAVQTKLGPYRDSCEIFYNISVAGGDLIVEVSDTGDFAGEEHQLHDEGSLTTGSDQHVTASTIGSILHEYARVYYTGANSDITAIEVTFK